MIPGVEILERQPHADNRGTFGRVFPLERLEGSGWSGGLHQVNLSTSPEPGTLRGLHYQLSSTPEFKLVTCTSGEIWDVVLDLRKDSPTFLQWEGHTLSGTNFKSLLIPPGCAHGFQTVRGAVEMVYCHSAPYEQDASHGINPFDPLLEIDWPLPVSKIAPQDKLRAFLDPAFEGLSL